MDFFTFAFYFFICQTIYDVISSLVRNYMLKKEFEKIRQQLVEETKIWN